MRLYASITIHDKSERDSLLRTLEAEWRVQPKCHNDTLEFYYMGFPSATRKLAGMCLEVPIHSVHLSA